MATRSMLLALAALVVTAAPATAADEALSGTFALAGGEARVEGHLQVTQSAPLTASLRLTYNDAETGEAVTAFTEELTQQLHLLAVDSTLSHLVHEHVKAPTTDGVFATEMRFPRAGTYHVYADAEPEGMGQQVLRFDVEIGSTAADPLPAQQSFDVDNMMVVSVGAYEVTIDARETRPHVEGAWHVAIRKDGRPASDLEPYLGVAAHAVLIRAADLSYVHAHPTEYVGGADDAGHNAHAAHSSDHAAEPMAPPAANAQAHGHEQAAVAQFVAPELTLHLTPPGPGRHTLFLEFIGGGEVQTIAVPLHWPPN